MALFWSKKSKAEKIYDKAATPTSKKGAAKTAKVVASGKSEKSAKPAKKEVAVVASPVMAGANSHVAGIILRPHITEKSGILSQSGVYTFQVSKSANKSSVAKAILALYKVKAVKVGMINQPAKKVFVKGRHGMVSAVRKAMVTVKKGDKIDFA